MKVTLTNHEKFEKRHQGKMSKELVSMCNEIGVENIEKLIDETVRHFLKRNCLRN